MCGVTPSNGEVRLSHSHVNSQEDEEDDFILVPCKCLGQEVNLLIDTGCKLNLMSSVTAERFGLKELVEEIKMETDGFPFQRRLCIDGHIKELGLTVGQIRITCSFAIVESNKHLMSLGSKTLKTLKVNLLLCNHHPSSPSIITIHHHHPSSPSIITIHHHHPSSPSIITIHHHHTSPPSILEGKQHSDCVIDTEQQIMVIGTTVREQIHFAKKQFSEGSTDFRDLGY
uniref:Nuclear receptor interacting protein 3 n=1 Tax=Maylandia zebra TaxID=106582 RepID=A0A3P9C400_9CICH